jgi:hypothetical protein
MTLSCTAATQQAVSQVLQGVHLTACVTVTAIFSKYIFCVQTLYAAFIFSVGSLKIKCSKIRIADLLRQSFISAAQYDYSIIYAIIMAVRSKV